MLLELEISRIAGWVHHRVLSPSTAAQALTHLLSLYLRADGRSLNLTLFEQSALSLFESHGANRTRDMLEAIITERAWRLLGPPRCAKGQVLAFSI